MSHRPVCVECGVEFKVVKNGAFLLDLHEDGSPYKLWAVDVHRCPKCGHEVAVSFAAQPVATDMDDDFEFVLARMKKAVGKWYIESNED